METALSFNLSFHIKVKELYLSISESHQCSQMLVAPRGWCFLMGSHLLCTSPHDSWEEMSLLPVTLWVMGRGQAMNKPFCVCVWLILHPSPLPQNLNFPFCGKQNPLFISPSMGLYGTQITWYHRGSFKDCLLVGMVGGVFVPVHWGEAFSTCILSDFTANSTHRGGYQLASKSTDVWQRGP